MSESPPTDDFRVADADAALGPSNLRRPHTTVAKPDRWPESARDYWRLLNSTLPLEPGVVRTLCLILTLAYIAISVVRVLSEGLELFWVRCAVVLYASAGVMFAHRFTWLGLRRYSAGVVLLLALSTSYIEAVRGYQPAEIALIAVATIAALPFVLTARDLLLTDALLLAGNGILLATASTVGSSLGAIATVLIGAIGAGTAVSVLLITYRGLTYESLAWWQQSFERERVLREFAEHATSSLASTDLLDGLASRFAETIPGGCCLFLFVEAGGPSFALAAAAGAGAPRRTPARVSAPVLRSLWRQVEGDPQPLTHEGITLEDRHELKRALALTFDPHGVAVLPVHGFLRGLILLLAPAASAMTEERLGMWQAMASQAAVAAANVRAWEELREQEASARRLAEERGRLADLRTHFISMTSHEFRTPLAAILAASEALDRYGERMTPAERHQRLRKIESEVKAMTELLDDLLVLGRAESGRLPFAPEPLELDRLCRELVSEVSTTACQTHEIVLFTDDLAREFNGDRGLLRKIIGNLLTNAVKYSPDGGPVELTLSRSNGSLVLRVRDHGIGIPSGELKDLFQPFHRGSNVGKIPGSGLGLAVTQKAVEAHGGTITVDSAVGGGTTFEVTIPDRAAG